MRDEIIKPFLQLVRLGLGKSRETKIFDEADCAQLKALAEKHGLSAVVLDGLNAVYDSEFMIQDIWSPNGLKSEETFYQRLSDAALTTCSKHYTLNTRLKLEWIGEVCRDYERRYELYKKSISDLAGFYNAYGYKMMVLKGLACSLNWPRPNRRPCGDIDIWLFGQQREADAALGSRFKVQGSKSGIDNSHHHHTVFEWEGFTVENHYDFVNVHYGHKNAELEKVFKELAQVDSNLVEVNGEKIYLPSPNLHALFLLRHCMQDFASAEMNLRQVLDWGFFVEKYTKEIDWDWLLETLVEFKMTDFYNCINAICVGDLGFDVSIFPNVKFMPELNDKVLNDILSPAYGREEPRELFKRLVYKYHRWQGNSWKQALCYGDSRWSAFWTGVWNHLLKPKSI